jgi:hypothetical protein
MKKKKLNSIENCIKNVLNKTKTQKLTTFVRAIKNCFVGHMRPAGCRLTYSTRLLWMEIYINCVLYNLLLL